MGRTYKDIPKWKKERMMKRDKQRREDKRTKEQLRNYDDDDYFVNYRKIERTYR